MTGTSPSLEFSAQQLEARNGAIACLSSRLARYKQLPLALQAQVQREIEGLSGLQQKLSQPLIQIAVFGLVSRGKSAVLNALFGEALFPTGPLNGVTQWPRSVRWSPPQTKTIQLELIDTPGLDEVSGTARAEMAQAIARCADLILFVSAGSPLPVEQVALAELAALAKPMIWVVNKADLYPSLTPESLYQSMPEGALQTILSPREIVLTAAAPAPVQVRHEWPDGRTQTIWESPPPQVEALRQTLLDLLNREGLLLLSFNVLSQVQAMEKRIVAAIAQFYEQPAQATQWRLWGFKALAIGIVPWMSLDLLVSFGLDIAQVRQFLKRYGLPATNYQIRPLWKALLVSSGSLGVAEVLTSGLGLGDSISATSLAVAVTQVAIAAYGAALVSRAAQSYFLNGATWDAQGSSFLLQALAKALTPVLLLYRLSTAIANPLTLEDPAVVQPSQQGTDRFS